MYIYIYIPNSSCIGIFPVVSGVIHYTSFHLQLNCLQVIYSEEERKYNKDITLGLIRSELLNLAEYNVHMAKLIDGGRNSK